MSRSRLRSLAGRGPRRGVGDEPVQARQILEVTLWTPNVVAGRGRCLDQRAQEIGTRKTQDTALEVDGDSLRAVQGLAGARELGCAHRRDRGQIGTPTHSLGIEITSTEVTTIGGLIVEHLGRIPQTGDRVISRGTDLEVVGVRRRTAERVRIRCVEEELIDSEAFLRSNEADG